MIGATSISSINTANSDGSGVVAAVCLLLIFALVVGFALWQLVAWWRRR